MKKTISFSLLLALGILSIGSVSLASTIPPPGTAPTDIEQCKKDGWKDYGDMFKNQGDCVGFVATDGKNLPDGPAK